MFDIGTDFTAWLSVLAQFEAKPLHEQKMADLLQVLALQAAKWKENDTGKHRFGAAAKSEQKKEKEEGGTAMKEWEIKNLGVPGRKQIPCCNRN